MTAAAKHGKRITHPSFLFSLYLSAPRAIILKPTPSPSFLVGSYGRTSLGERGLRGGAQKYVYFRPRPLRRLQPGANPLLRSFYGGNGGGAACAYVWIWGRVRVRRA